jgi:hypothetical protein
LAGEAPTEELAGEAPAEELAGAAPAEDGLEAEPVEEAAPVDEDAATLEAAEATVDEATMLELELLGLGHKSAAALTFPTAQDEASSV